MGCNVEYGSVLVSVELDSVSDSVPDEDVLPVVLLLLVLLMPVVVVLQEQVTGVELKLLGGGGPTPTQYAFPGQKLVPQSSAMSGFHA
jgi:hypothetical protein